MPILCSDKATALKNNCKLKNKLQLKNSCKFLPDKELHKTAGQRGAACAAWQDYVETGPPQNDAKENDDFRLEH